MLHVDPVKRLTISEIMVHPWFTPNLPRYLSPLPTPGPVLGTLSSLVQPVKQLDFEIIEGLGRIDEDVVDELGPALVEASPIRVVRSALARAEVRSPIPAVGDVSPEGPHTHLLPARLELGAEVPEATLLPPGWVASASAWLVAAPTARRAVAEAIQGSGS